MYAGVACVRAFWEFELQVEADPELLPAASRAWFVGVALHAAPPPFQALHHLVACSLPNMQISSTWLKVGIRGAQQFILQGRHGEQGAGKTARHAQTMSVPSPTALQVGTRCLGVMKTLHELGAIEKEPYCRCDRAEIDRQVDVSGKGLTSQIGRTKWKGLAASLHCMCTKANHGLCDDAQRSHAASKAQEKTACTGCSMLGGWGPL